MMPKGYFEVVFDIRLFIHSSMTLQPFVGTWPVLQFRGLFIHAVGLLGRGISPSEGRYLGTGQQNCRINAHTNIHTFEWDSNSRSQRSSERRQFMPQTARPLCSALDMHSLYKIYKRISFCKNKAIGKYNNNDNNDSDNCYNDDNNNNNL
jgi:hypothetical protein